MTGKILGYNPETNTGSIAGDDGKRYSLSKDDWKESISIQKNAKVDFEIADNGSAKEIYLIHDKSAENNETIMGLLAIALTFFLGFIGTFISRLAIAKQPVGKTIVPTLIHFVITLLALIPVLGWIIYLIGTGYYMYKNYILVTTDSHALKNKYE